MIKLPFHYRDIVEDNVIGQRACRRLDVQITAVIGFHHRIICVDDPPPPQKITLDVSKDMIYTLKNPHCSLTFGGQDNLIKLSDDFIRVKNHQEHQKATNYLKIDYILHGSLCRQIDDTSCQINLITPSDSHTKRN